MTDRTAIVVGSKSCSVSDGSIATIEVILDRSNEWDRTVPNSICLVPALDNTALDTDEQWRRIVDALTRRGFLGAGLGCRGPRHCWQRAAADENGSAPSGLVTVQDETGQCRDSVGSAANGHRPMSAPWRRVLDLGVPPEKIVGGFFGLEGCER